MSAEKQSRNLSLLKRVSENTELEEGEEGIRKILREIHRNQKISTKELASLTQIPLPIVAAVRRELEREDLITREKGALLTQEGERFVKENLGLAYSQRLTCPTCQARGIQIPESFRPILGKLRKYLDLRPRPLTRLDQAHGTPETALHRALYMLEKGDVEGRRILFLGDDDLTSIAVALLRAAREITVIDIDIRLLEVVQLANKREGLNIEFLEHDLREPLPERLHYRYDVVFTDPPYTKPGLTLFVSRGITALQLRKGASIYLAYASQSPRKMLEVQKILTAVGLIITDRIPRFNTYEGAEMFANTTILVRLETTEKTKPLIIEAFEGKMYTGEITKTIRTYQCRCGETASVGETEPFQTIEELKAGGCPKCGRKKGFKLTEKQKLKEILLERLTLRKFQWTDLPTILEFEREIARKSFPEAPILDEDYHKKKLERAVESGHDGLRVAVLGNEVVGWLWLRVEKDRSTDEEFGYIKSIIVKPDYRYQELGKKLIEAAEEYFRGKGIRRIDVIASAANYEATLFFEALGYEREHSTMRKRLGQKGECDR
jgi:predicted methyltransferase/ribosomal protein S18 acetylase RimI-like enzyme